MSVGHKPSLVEEIERDALDGDASLAAALRKCVALGGHARSAELRDWATLELQGYGDGDVPDYRTVAAPIVIDGFSGNQHITGQQVGLIDLPEFVRDKVAEEVTLRPGVRELEEMVRSARADGTTVRLGLPMGADIARLMTHEMNDPSRSVERIYWSVSPVAVVGILDQIRTRLVRLVAELRATSPNPNDPSPLEATNAVNVVINGKARDVNINAAQSGSQGSSTVRPPPDPERPWWKRTKVIFGLVAGIASIAGLLAVWHPWT